MARYRLTTSHFSEEDRLIEATEDKPVEVGDGTLFKWTRPPTIEMEPLDDGAREAIERERERLGGRNQDPLDDLPMTLEPREQLRLVLQNLNPNEARELLEQEMGDLAPIVKGAKI
jgi:hypothetical protein